MNKSPIHSAVQKVPLLPPASHQSPAATPLFTAFGFWPSSHIASPPDLPCPPDPREWLPVNAHPVSVAKPHTSQAACLSGCNFRVGVSASPMKHGSSWAAEYQAPGTGRPALLWSYSALTVKTHHPERGPASGCVSIPSQSLFLFQLRTAPTLLFWKPRKTALGHRFCSYSSSTSSPFLHT